MSTGVRHEALANGHCREHNEVLGHAERQHCQLITRSVHFSLGGRATTRRPELPPCPSNLLVLRHCGTAVLRWCIAAASGLPGFVVTRKGFALFAAGTERARNTRREAGKRRQETMKDGCLSVTRVSRVDPVVWLPVRSHSLHKSPDGNLIVAFDYPASPAKGWQRIISLGLQWRSKTNGYITDWVALLNSRQSGRGSANATPDGVVHRATVLEIICVSHRGTCCTGSR
ncbi:hypothetical protein F4823DRAFT_195688 [Ustulina deusta]|nr:hypothetical protein F4823DRAFT_195688 [Ustulina deusta]